MKYQLLSNNIINYQLRSSSINFMKYQIYQRGLPTDRKGFSLCHSHQNPICYNNTSMIRTKEFTYRQNCLTHQLRTNFNIKHQQGHGVHKLFIKYFEICLLARKCTCSYQRCIKYRESYQKLTNYDHNY